MKDLMAMRWRVYHAPTRQMVEFDFCDISNGFIEIPAIDEESRPQVAALADLPVMRFIGFETYTAESEIDWWEGDLLQRVHGGQSQLGELVYVPHLGSFMIRVKQDGLMSGSALEWYLDHAQKVGHIYEPRWHWPKKWTQDIADTQGGPV